MTIDSRLRELLEYDPATGLFRWKVIRAHETTKKRGWFDGCRAAKGYRGICVLGVGYKAHWLAWVFTHEEAPPDGMLIDHINGDPADNRIANLRLATPSQNQRNRRCSKRSATQVKNVWRDPSSKKNPYMARVILNGRRTYLGHFRTAEEAGAVALAAAQKIYGEYAR